jgi:O-antigen/teichoic acid export membrane protein
MFRNILFTLISRALFAICNFLIIIIISRYLGAEGRGQHSYIIANIAIIITISGIFSGPFISYFIPRLPLFQIIFIGLTAIILIPAFALIPLQFLNYIQLNHLLIIYLIIVLQSINNFKAYLLIGYEAIKKANIILLTPVLILLLSLLLCIVLNNYFTIYIFLILYVVSLLISICLSFIFIGSVYKKSIQVSFKKIKLSLISIFKLGIANQLHNTFQLLVQRFSYFVIISYLGTVVLGIFSNAASITEASFLITHSISMVMYSRIINLSDKNEAWQYTTKFFKLTQVIFIFIIIVFIAIPDSFYPYIFGKEFIQLRFYIILFLPSVTLTGLNALFIHFFSGIGKIYYNTIIAGIASLLIVCLCYILIPHYGLVGAILANLISSIAAIIVSIIILSRKEKLPLQLLLLTKYDFKQWYQSAKIQIGSFIQK